MTDHKEVENKGKKAQGKSPLRKVLFWIWGVFFGCLVLVFLLFTGISREWFGDMPSFEELENPKTLQATELYSFDRELLGKYYYENRSNVEFREISPNLTNALVAIEDARFYEHSGIDEVALFGVLKGLLTGNNRGGGSTLTQQLAKNLFPRGERLSKPRLVLRKLQEWVTATKLEHNYSKEEIMAMYLNTVPFGNNSFGVKAASKTFFNKVPDSLALQEAALLAGVVNAPTRYNPIRNPENAMHRRNLVLDQMEKYNFIPEQVCDSVKQLPIDMSQFGVLDHNSGSARYFREYVRSFMKKWCKTHLKPNGKPYDLYSDGLRIYTTIDSRLQKYAEEAVAEHLGKDLQPTFDKHMKGYKTAPFVFPRANAKKQIQRIMNQAVKRSARYYNLKKYNLSNDSIAKIFNTPVKMSVFAWNDKGSVDTIMSPMDSIRYYKAFLRAGLMSMEPQTGYVKAYVGGIDYKYFKFDQVSQGARQVGSTFKPFLYSLAMQDGGLTPCSRVANISYSVKLPEGGFWEPENASSKRIGEEVTLKWALANSNNWISAYLINRFTPQALVKLAHKMGVSSKIPAVPSIALGAADIKLREMVAGLNTLSDQGVYVEPVFITRIEDRNGNILERFTPRRNEAMSDLTAYKMLELMKGVVESGTGVRLKYKYGFKNPIAGKTGTTNNQSDGWFMGLTPDLTTGVWVGAEDRSVHFRTIKYGQGANMALPIWAIYMKKAYADQNLHLSQDDFEKPASAIGYSFDCHEGDTKKDKGVSSSVEEDVF
ncbi:MAG: penicillin-binding protein 1A [Bacteroidales bacterium]